jgi:hypothetical protein
MMGRLHVSDIGQATRRRLTRACGACLLLVCASFPQAAAAHASGFRRLAKGTMSFASDGATYGAWQSARGTPVVVLDTGTGRRAEVRVPSKCTLEDQRQNRNPGPPAGDGRFLLQCGELAELLDARTGATTPLPSGDGWLTVGSRYVEGLASPALPCVQSTAERRHEESCIALYDISTGAVSWRPQSQVGDIDRQDAPIICSALRRTLLPERTQSFGYLFAYNDGLLARPASHGRVQIDRCHKRPIILPGHGEPMNFDLRSGILTWDTGHSGEFYNPEENPVTGSVYAYNLATHKLRSWRLPQLPFNTGEAQPTIGAFGYSTHTTNTIFWIVPENNDRGVKLPQLGSAAIYARPMS